MLQPAELKSDQKLLWSPGHGRDLWELFQACVAGDLEAVQALVTKDRSLPRAHYQYRKPLYFAVRENRVDVARFLLEHDSNPMDLWVDDDPLEIARDRGYAEMRRVLADTLETRFNASPKSVPDDPLWATPLAWATRRGHGKIAKLLVLPMPAEIPLDRFFSVTLAFVGITIGGVRDGGSADHRSGHRGPVP